MSQPSGDRLAALIERVRRRDYQVGVVGLGYVGLPLALAFAEQGFTVLGFDIDAAKIAALAAGECYIDHLDDASFADVLAAGRLTAAGDFDRLGEADAVLICVPTPLTADRRPDLRFVESTGLEIAARLRRDQLVVLESTTYPGTTEELLRPLLETPDRRCGEDFFLAFSPEREDPGNRDFGTTGIPKVVGGVDPAAGELAAALYGEVFAGVVPVSSARAAEATKLMENVFRAVNIALVNELKTVYEPMGVDIWEVLDAAATKPFGFMRFTPGPGWGGHCIPIDPFYLAWKARQHGQTARFIELAGEVNREMTERVVDRLSAALEDRGKALRGATVLILGIAYKPDIADPRESPAFEIIDLLLAAGAEVCYHDPHIAEAPAMRTWPELPPMRSVELDDATLGEQDAVLLITHHRDIDYARVAEQAALVVDTRGVYRPAPGNVIPA